MADKSPLDEEYQTDSEFAGEAHEVPDPDFVDKPDIEKEDEDQKEENEFDQDGYEPKSFYQNLAEKLTPEEHEELFVRYIEDYLPTDKEARSKRDEQYEEGIKRTGVSKDAPGGADFQGASRAVHPGLGEACVDFCARSMKEIFPPAGPVRIKIDGRLTKDKLDRAERKRRHMNWQATTEISEYRPTIEQVLTQLPLGGAQYIKFYPDFLRKRPSCEFVRCEKVTFPYNCTDFYNAQRVFHEFELSEFEFKQRIAAKLYIDDQEIAESSSMDDRPEPSKTQIQENKVEGKDTPSDNIDGDRPFVDVYMLDTLDVDNEAKEDRGAAPYLMTVDVNNRKIVALYRNWEKDDKTQAKMDWLIKWGFIPWDGPLEIGLPHLIGSLSGAATGAMRALLDSALTQTIPTGVMLKGTQVSGQSKQVGPTKVTVLENRQGLGIDDINKIFQHIPFNPPSPVLLSLLEFVDGKIGSVVRTTAETANDNINMPVGTKLANIEQALTVYSSIHQRLHEAQAKCLSVIHRINRMYMEDKPYDPDLGFAVREDYEGKIDVQPVSDPNIYSESQRFGQLQAVFQLIQVFPEGGFDIQAVIKWALATMRIPNAEEIFPDKAKPKDENPAAENIMMCMGQPAIALPDQDHEAHMRCLMDFAASPLFGKNPLFQSTFLPLALNHAKQHILYWYAALTHEITEQAVGSPISSIQDEDEEVAKKFSQLVSLASPGAMQQLQAKLAPYQQLLNEAMQFVQQTQQQMQMKNPNPLQIEAAAQQADAQAKASDAQTKQAETQLKAKEFEAKQAETAANMQVKQSEVQQDAQKDMADNQIKQQQIAIAEEGNQIDLIKNQDDNKTALDISAMRATTGHGVGGLKDGTSIGEF